MTLPKCKLNDSKAPKKENTNCLFSWHNYRECYEKLLQGIDCTIWFDIPHNFNFAFHAIYLLELLKCWYIKNYCLVSLTCFHSLYCVWYMACSCFRCPITLIYYINITEIPGELWRENMIIFTHMKRSLLLWLHNKLCLSQWNWNALVYHECLYNTQNITWPLGDTEFLFSCWKIFHWFGVLTHEIFSALEEKFRISAPPCNIVYVCVRQTILANFTP